VSLEWLIEGHILPDKAIDLGVKAKNMLSEGQ